MLNTIGPGEDPTKVALVEIDFWIQIYALPVGYMSEVVGKQLGNFFGRFLEYDTKNNSTIWREYMRLKIRVDVRNPLKRKKKICKKDKTEVIVHCKYEKLGDLCFICGLISHTERFCKKKVDGEGTSEPREWGGWLRAPPRRKAGGNRSKWMRDDNGGDWENRQGSDNYEQRELRKVGPQNLQSKHSGPHDKEKVVNNAESSRANKGVDNISNFKEGIFSHNLGNGPQEGDELSGLTFEERKRQRSGDNGPFDNSNSNNMVETDSGFSGLDYSESSP